MAALKGKMSWSISHVPYFAQNEVSTFEKIRSGSSGGEQNEKQNKNEPELVAGREGVAEQGAEVRERWLLLPSRRR